MLAKAFHYSKQNLRSQSASPMVALTKRGIYKQGTEPYVFINKHTKVICQGMTGKHVRYSSSLNLIGHIPHSASHQLRH